MRTLAKGAGLNNPTAAASHRGGRNKMYRSVVESEQQGSERRRLWRWAEGILVAVVVLVGVTYLFGLLSF